MSAENFESSLPKKSGKRKHTGVPNLGERIKYFLGEKEMSISELAAVGEVPLSSISRIVSGKNPNPGLDISLRISGALDISLSELVGDIEPAPKMTHEPQPPLQLEEISLQLGKLIARLDQMEILIRKSVNQTLLDI